MTPYNQAGYFEELFKTVAIGFTLFLTVFGAFLIALGAVPTIAEVLILNETGFIAIGLILVVPGCYFFGQAVRQKLVVNASIEGRHDVTPEETKQLVSDVFKPYLEEIAEQYSRIEQPAAKRGKFLLVAYAAWTLSSISAGLMGIYLILTLV